MLAALMLAASVLDALVLATWVQPGFQQGGFCALAVIAKRELRHRGCWGEIFEARACYFWNASIHSQQPIISCKLRNTGTFFRGEGNRSVPPSNSLSDCQTPCNLRKCPAEFQRRVLLQNILTSQVYGWIPCGFLVLLAYFSDYVHR